ncbi:hypothetical protein C8J27_107127 [Rhodobacter aestuarii]|uniref:PH domain-containing protein n=1 Tax=Rhodobacter aestuarii TaxID=453582 RepID=A0A1N7NRF1_9RHOB|nr:MULTISPECIES: hypothetical protein [Rhodobacter]PTV94596.1 hypothetical protein C8J27_107127 [Rhodobacter aestuarii]SIT00904.1 hypothetical protein SAMN05421580_108100 [Rhodobacter aestuarii]SOC12647.1 hypothetical protein SAMN05877809_106126 [Rhodobacter sp. JA431]
MTPQADHRPDLVVQGRALMPHLWAAGIILIGLVQAISPVLGLVEMLRGGGEDGMIWHSVSGLVGAVLCFFLAWVLWSMPRPALVFRHDRLEVARFWGKYTSVSYSELHDKDEDPATAGGKAAVRLRKLSIPGWVMTKEENAAWRAELVARVPSLGAAGQ